MGLLNELVRCRVFINAWAKDENDNLLEGDYAALKTEIIFVSDSPDTKKSLMIGVAAKQFYIYDKENDTFWQRDRDCFYWT